MTKRKTTPATPGQMPKGMPLPSMPKMPDKGQMMNIDDMMRRGQRGQGGGKKKRGK